MLSSNERGLRKSTWEWFAGVITSAGQRLLLIDYTMVLLLLFLSIVGIAVLYSASGQNPVHAFRQITHLLIGFFFLLLLAQASPYFFKRIAFWLYLFSIFLAYAVLYFGPEINGSHRWLVLGPLTLQPSELLKLTTPMVLAWLFTCSPFSSSKWRFPLALLLIAWPAMLVAPQPDLGTAVLIMVSGLLVFFLAGCSWRWLLTGFLLAVICAPLAWDSLQSYQRTRIEIYLGLDSTTQANNYHADQSRVAIGSGGMTGKGWLKGTQSHLDFVPETSTDFAFSVLTEEFGFTGYALLLLVYFTILLRCVMVAMRAGDSFNRLMAAAISLSFFFYFLVNAGMVSGLLPVVGVPLPLVSHGGSSAVVLLASLGILLGIERHERLKNTDL